MDGNPNIYTYMDIICSIFDTYQQRRMSIWNVLVFNRPSGVEAKKKKVSGDTPVSSPGDACDHPLIADVITR